MLKTNKKGNIFPLRVRKIRKRTEEIAVSEIESPVFPIVVERKTFPKFRNVVKENSVIETPSFFTETESITIDNPQVSVEPELDDIGIEHFCKVEKVEEIRMELKRNFVERVANGIVIHLDNGNSIELKKHFTDASVYRMNKHMNEVYGDESVRILLINSGFITDSGDTMVVYELSEEQNY